MSSPVHNLVTALQPGWQLTSELSRIGEAVTFKQIKSPQIHWTNLLSQKVRKSLRHEITAWKRAAKWVGEQWDELTTNHGDSLKKLSSALAKRRISLYKETHGWNAFLLYLLFFIGGCAHLKRKCRLLTALDSLDKELKKSQEVEAYLFDQRKGDSLAHFLNHIAFEHVTKEELDSARFSTPSTFFLARRKEALFYVYKSPIDNQIYSEPVANPAQIAIFRRHHLNLIAMCKALSGAGFTLLTQNEGSEWPLSCGFKQVALSLSKGRLYYRNADDQRVEILLDENVKGIAELTAKLEEAALPLWFKHLRHLASATSSIRFEERAVADPREKYHHFLRDEAAGEPSLKMVILPAHDLKKVTLYYFDPLTQRVESHERDVDTKEDLGSLKAAISALRAASIARALNSQKLLSQNPHLRIAAEAPREREEFERGHTFASEDFSELLDKVTAVPDLADDRYLLLYYIDPLSMELQSKRVRYSHFDGPSSLLEAVRELISENRGNGDLLVQGLRDLGYSVRNTSPPANSGRAAGVQIYLTRTQCVVDIVHTFRCQGCPFPDSETLSLRVDGVDKIEEGLQTLRKRAQDCQHLRDIIRNHADWHYLQVGQSPPVGETFSLYLRPTPDGAGITLFHRDPLEPTRHLSLEITGITECEEAVIEVERRLLKSSPAFLKLRAGLLNQLSRLNKEALAPLEGIDLNELLTLFSRLNFRDPGSPYYCRGDDMREDNGAYVNFRYVREGITILIDAINENRPHSGTPGNDWERGDYYKNLATYLRHIIQLLKGLGSEVDRDPSKFALFKATLIALGIGGHHCGGRWMGEAIQQYGILSSLNGAAAPSEDLGEQMLYWIDEFKTAEVIAMAQEGNNGEPTHTALYYMRRLRSMGVARFPNEKNSSYNDPFQNIGNRRYSTDEALQNEFLNRFQTIQLARNLQNKFKEALPLNNPKQFNAKIAASFIDNMRAAMQRYHLRCEGDRKEIQKIDDAMEKEGFILFDEDGTYMQPTVKGVLLLMQYFKFIG